MKRICVILALWMVLAECVMVAGYFVVEWLALGYGLAAAASAVLPNVVQGMGGVLIAMVFLPMLQRVKKITRSK